MIAFLPKVGEAMVENTGQPRPSYRRWMQAVTEAVNQPASPPAPEPEPTPPVSFVINGSGSVTADGSIAGGEFVVRLDNDQDEPGNTKYYGTDGSGNRGFVALSEGMEAGTGIVLTDSGYTMLPSVATPDDLPLTGNAGEAVRVTDEAPGVYAWDGSAFTLDTAADGKVGVKLDDAPSDGSTYGRKNGAWALAGGGSGAMVLVASATVAGSAATSLSLTGLDLAADGKYVMQFSFKNASGASTAYISLVYNSDSTAANYFAHATAFGTSGAPSNSTNSTGRFCGMAASEYADGESIIQRRRDGKPVAMSKSVCCSASAFTTMQDFSTLWNNTANVTTLDIVCNVANALDVGSFVKLWKVG